MNLTTTTTTTIINPLIPPANATLTRDMIGPLEQRLNTVVVVHVGYNVTVEKPPTSGSTDDSIFTELDLKISKSKFPFACLNGEKIPPTPIVGETPSARTGKLSKVYDYRLYSVFDCSPPCNLTMAVKIHNVIKQAPIIAAGSANWPSSLFTKESALQAKAAEKLMEAATKTIKTLTSPGTGYLQCMRATWGDQICAIVSAAIEFYFLYARGSFFVLFFPFLSMEALGKMGILDNSVLALDCLSFLAMNRETLLPCAVVDAFMPGNPKHCDYTKYRKALLEGTRYLLDVILFKQATLKGLQNAIYAQTDAPTTESKAMMQDLLDFTSSGEGTNNLCKSWVASDLSSRSNSDHHEGGGRVGSCLNEHKGRSMSEDSWKRVLLMGVPPTTSSTNGIKGEEESAWATDAELIALNKHNWFTITTAFLNPTLPTSGHLVHLPIWSNERVTLTKVDMKGTLDRGHSDKYTSDVYSRQIKETRASIKRHVAWVSGHAKNDRLQLEKARNAQRILKIYDGLEAYIKSVAAGRGTTTSKNVSVTLGDNTATQSTEPCVFSFHLTCSVHYNTFVCNKALLDYETIWRGDKTALTDAYQAYVDKTAENVTALIKKRQTKDVISPPPPKTKGKKKTKTIAEAIVKLQQKVGNDSGSGDGENNGGQEKEETSSSESSASINDSDSDKSEASSSSNDTNSVSTSDNASYQPDSELSGHELDAIYEAKLAEKCRAAAKKELEDLVNTKKVDKKQEKLLKNQGKIVKVTTGGSSEEDSDIYKSEENEDDAQWDKEEKAEKARLAKKVTTLNKNIEDTKCKMTKLKQVSGEAAKVEYKKATRRMETLKKSLAETLESQKGGLALLKSDVSHIYETKSGRKSKQLRDYREVEERIKQGIALEKQKEDSRVSKQGKGKNNSSNKRPVQALSSKNNDKKNTSNHPPAKKQKGENGKPIHVKNIVSPLEEEEEDGFF